MRTLKCSLFLLWALLFSTSALAASASAYMDNFSLDVTGGTITQRDNSYVSTDASVIGDRQQHYSYAPAADFSFFSSTAVANATDTAAAEVSFGPNNPDSYMSASVYGEDQHFTFADSYLFYTYNYQANTTVTISADAFITFQPDSGSEYLGTSSASIGLRDLINPNDYFSSHLLIEQNTQPFSRFERLSATFLAPIDTVLFIAYGVQARINDAPVTPIPEPETYAMMLAGLGLIGFVGKRNPKNEMREKERDHEYLSKI